MADVTILNTMGLSHCVVKAIIWFGHIASSPLATVQIIINQEQISSCPRSRGDSRGTWTHHRIPLFVCNIGCVSLLCLYVRYALTELTSVFHVGYTHHMLYLWRHTWPIYWKKFCQDIPSRETVEADGIVTSCKQTRTEMLKMTKTEINCERVIFYYSKCMSMVAFVKTRRGRYLRPSWVNDNQLSAQMHWTNSKPICRPILQTANS